jgi:hypothetical protein
MAPEQKKEQEQATSHTTKDTQQPKNHWEWETKQKHSM